MNIAIIPARGGSKRIPKKNIKEFCGKPLIAYSIETALNSKLFDKVLVSTDSNEIAQIAKEYGAEIQMRPKELSDDLTGTWDVIEYVLSTLEQKYEFVCTIYATAPFLEIEYLKKGYEKLKNSSAVRAFSVTTMPFPIQRTFKVIDDRCEMFTPEFYNTRSQDLEEAYQDAGQFYWEKKEKKSEELFFGKDSIPIVLPRHLVQDIDTFEDFIRAEYMYKAIFPNRFDKWSVKKQQIQENKQILKFRERDIFFMSIGQNIGYETYGKGFEYLRPVLIIRKFNNRTFFGIPLSSKIKEGKYYFKIEFKDRINIALLSQAKVFDIKRAKYFLAELNEHKFLELKEELTKVVNPSKKRGAVILQTNEVDKL